MDYQNRVDHDMSELKSFNVNGIEMACHVTGNGPPLLLVHGFPLDHSMWKFQIEELSRSFLIIAPDTRGYGQSNSFSGTVSLEQLADDLALLLNQIVGNEPVCFCGHSMGGYIAWQFAKNHRSQLGQLILVDTRACADDDVTRRARQMLARRVEQQGTGFLAIDMIGKLFAAESITKYPETVEHIRDVIRKTNKQTVAAGQLAMADRADFSDWMPNIGVPTLVLAGELDTISTPEEMKQIANAIPAAQFREIQGAGHMVPIEKPDEFNKIVSQFLLQHAEIDRSNR